MMRRASWSAGTSSHDRLEIFRGQGVRLEPLPEAELEPMLLENLGLHTCQVFESTILIRQAETAWAGRDRLTAGRLAEAFGRKSKGGDEDAGAAKALQAIRDKLAQADTLTDLESDVAARERTLAQIDQGFRATPLWPKNGIACGPAWRPSRLI